MVNIYLTIWVAQFILFRSLRPKGAAFPAQQHSATCYLFGGGQECCCSRGTHLGEDRKGWSLPYHSHHSHKTTHLPTELRSKMGS